VPLLGHPVPGPHRARQGTLDDALEAGAERLRHHLRRPHHTQHQQLKITDAPDQLHRKSDIQSPSARNAVSEGLIVEVKRPRQFRMGAKFAGERD
jgi:hypothetical protein